MALVRALTLRYLMHRCCVACAVSTILALALGFCMPLALSGCGGSSEDGMVKVEKSPTEVAKDSINYYLKTKSQQKAMR